jgi:hypothetical protein
MNNFIKGFSAVFVTQYDEKVKGDLPKEGREPERERGSGGGWMEAANEARPPNQFRSRLHSVRRRVKAAAPVEPILAYLSTNEGE